MLLCVCNNIIYLICEGELVFLCVDIATDYTHVVLSSLTSGGSTSCMLLMGQGIIELPYANDNCVFLPKHIHP